MTNNLEGFDVLVVEDDDDGRELLEFVLQAEGAVVRAAASAADALAILASWRPSILLGDITLPGEDGFAFLSHARALHPELPAIAVTGHVGRAFVDRALAAGYDHHIPKPIDPEDLIAAIFRFAARPGA